MSWVLLLRNSISKFYWPDATIRCQDASITFRKNLLDYSSTLESLRRTSASQLKADKILSSNVNRSKRDHVHFYHQLSNAKTWINKTSMRADWCSSDIESLIFIIEGVTFSSQIDEKQKPREIKAFFYSIVKAPLGQRYDELANWQSRRIKIRQLVHADSSQEIVRLNKLVHTLVVLQRCNSSSLYFQKNESKDPQRYH